MAIGDRIGDVAGFIRTHTRLMPVPHAPELSLYVADEATGLWLKTEEELGEIGLPPPFWAFAWAGGQALARYILDHPETVRGKSVLDFASGSGLVGLAACKAGARHVSAAEIDPFAATAISLNAEANGLTGQINTLTRDLIGEDQGWEVILAGDICYQRDLADRVVAWLSGLNERGALVLIGDPGRAYLPKEQLVTLATYRVPTTRALEDSETKQTSVWRFRGY
jgi:predicted nicotinamide N-methyase